MGKLHDNINLTSRRKDLRNNATFHEKMLWEYIRPGKLGFKFRRQHSIGKFIVDLYCPEKRLIIELDGNSHRETRVEDRARDDYFNSLDYRAVNQTIRFEPVDPGI